MMDGLVKIPASDDGRARSNTDATVNTVAGDSERPRANTGATSVATTAVVLSMPVKISYAIPRFTIRAAYVIIQVYGQLYYMQLGARLRFMAFYNSIGRALDVITDPAMGWITDSTRSPIGRRKPYLIAGMILYPACFGALFYPPATGNVDVLTHWYGISYCLFFVLDTFANVPYYALGMELTSDYDQRNTLYFWQHVFGQAGTMIGGVLPAVLSDFAGMALRDAYAITGWSFGAFYALGNFLVLVMIKERPLDRLLKQEAENPPLVREMLRIFRNRAFAPWMMAYILDYAAIGILATMVPLFSQYVLVQPDKTDCAQQCRDANRGETCTCASLATEWLGWIMAATFLSAMASVPFWHWVAKRYKKHTAWLIYSWWNALTGPLRIFCGKGSLMLTAILSAINGSAFGGQFIGESVMADLSDYDEFLYGDRSEGMLGVVATLGPKMVLVVCFVIPLAAVAAAGFQDSVWPEGTLANVAAGVRPCPESEHLDACPKRPQPQNEVVIWLTRLGVSVVPTILALASNLFKYMFPLKRREQMEEILAGIEAHKQGCSAWDPISKKHVTVVRPKDARERRQMWALETWGAVIGGNSRYLQKVLATCTAESTQKESSAVVISKKAWKVLECRAWGHQVASILTFAGSTVATVACFGMLDKESTSWVPTSLCICSGCGLVWFVISTLRLRTASHISGLDMSVEFLRTMLTRSADEATVATVRETDAGDSARSPFVQDSPPRANESRALLSPTLHQSPKSQFSTSEASPKPQFFTGDGGLEDELRPPMIDSPCPWHGARPPRLALRSTADCRSARDGMAERDERDHDGMIMPCFLAPCTLGRSS